MSLLAIRINFSAIAFHPGVECWRKPVKVSCYVWKFDYNIFRFLLQKVSPLTTKWAVVYRRRAVLKSSLAKDGVLFPLGR